MAALTQRESVRLTLVGGCIAAAAVADVAGSVFPQPKLVAIGAALLGGLVVLRRKPRAPSEQGVTDDEYVAIRSPRRFGRTRFLAERRLELASARIDALDSRFTELSGRHTLLKMMVRDGLDDAERRLAKLEGRIDDLFGRPDDPRA